MNHDTAETLGGQQSNRQVDKRAEAHDAMGSACNCRQQKGGLVTASCRANKMDVHQSVQIVLGHAMGFSLTNCPEQLAV